MNASTVAAVLDLPAASAATANVNGVSVWMLGHCSQTKILTAPGAFRAATIPSVYRRGSEAGAFLVNPSSIPQLICLQVVDWAVRWDVELYKVVDR